MGSGTGRDEELPKQLSQGAESTHPVAWGQGKSSRKEWNGGSLLLHSGQGVGAMPAPNSGSTNPPNTSAKSTWSPKES